jgi:hypothetical protein
MTALIIKDTNDRFYNTAMGNDNNVSPSSKYLLFTIRKIQYKWVEAKRYTSILLEQTGMELPLK